VIVVRSKARLLSFGWNHPAPKRLPSLDADSIGMRAIQAGVDIGFWQMLFNWQKRAFWPSCTGGA
jgi:hypothetical protein